jgi:Icc-related predicted phosphoesterase
MRIVHISDTHKQHKQIEKIPDGDVLIHSGDFTNYGFKEDVEDFFEWFIKKPHTYKIIIPGNHDRTFDPRLEGNTEKPDWLKELLSEYTKHKYLNFYLEHSSCSIWGVNFFGSPHVPKLKDRMPTRWAFSHDRDQMSSYWKNLPKNIDVLITHGPPYGKRDWAVNPIMGGPAGCESLRYFVKFLQPRLHLFGHIHEEYGITYDEHTIYSNASLVDPTYRVVNTPLIFDINEISKIVDIPEQEHLYHS